MDAENLGRMFAPSIIRHETNTMDVAAAQAEAVIVSYFIVNVLAFSNRRSKDPDPADPAEDGKVKVDEAGREREGGSKHVGSLDVGVGVGEEEKAKIDFGDDDVLETTRSAAE